MPNCPNCGLATQRTKDWVCQWCGYPLVSNSFRVIDKTFKELQEERKSAAKPSAVPLESVPENKPDPEPRREPPRKPAAQQRPPYISYPQPKEETPPAYVNPIKPQPKEETPPVYTTPILPQPKEEAPPVSITPVQPQPKEETPAAFVTPPQSLPKEETPPVLFTPPPSQPSPASEPPPPRVIEPDPAPVDATPPAQKQPLPAASKPEFIVEPEPEPMPELLIDLDDIEDGMELAVEQIDALFKTQQEAANAAFAGKTFIVQGIVEKVFIRDHLDIRYILLTGIMKGITWSLRCTFEKENARELTALQEGQAIKIQGTYDGVGKNVIFKDCSLA